MCMYYTIEEAAERFGVTPRTVRGWVFHKTIPYTKLGKFVRFSDEQLNSFVVTREGSGVTNTELR